MKDIEKKILEAINILQRNGVFSLESISSDLLKELRELPFGTVSQEFLDHPDFKKYIKEKSNSSLKYWLVIEAYFKANNDQQQVSEILTQLEEEIKKTLNKKYNLSEHRCLSDTILIRNVYLSKDEKLIKVFMRLLPIPSAEIFKGYEVPNFISERERNALSIMLKIFNKTSLESVEKSALIIQRQFRARQRLKEEIKRISKVYKHYIKLPQSAELNEPENVKRLIVEANTPYLPCKCGKELAVRIFNAAKKVTLFSSIRHVTTTNALQSILDDGLYGRRTLENFYMPYQRAALAGCDVTDGDVNVICFGPRMIDPACGKDDKIEIKLDLEKIQSTNPHIFYKQRDFGYHPRRKRTVMLGEKAIIFSHTDKRLKGDMNCINLQIFSPSGELISYAELPKYLFIAYDLEHIHQILTLNFFRFLDNLHTRSTSNHDHEQIESIYFRLSRLKQKELVHFLENLGKQMTDTAEFNFFGAHKIDLSSILTIKSKDYTITLSKFINELQSGNVASLHAARTNIPNLFKSYRFVEYLISKISHEEIKNELISTRKDCTIPLWLEMKEKNITDESEIAIHQIERQQKDLQEHQRLEEEKHQKQKLEELRNLEKQTKLDELKKLEEQKNLEEQQTLKTLETQDKSEMQPKPQQKYEEQPFKGRVNELRLACDDYQTELKKIKNNKSEQMKVFLGQLKNTLDDTTHQNDDRDKIEQFSTMLSQNKSKFRLYNDPETDKFIKRVLKILGIVLLSIPTFGAVAGCIALYSYWTKGSAIHFWVNPSTKTEEFYTRVRHRLNQPGT